MHRIASEVQALVDEYGGQLYALGVRFCGDRTEAEDLVQEVFLQAYRAWDSFEGRSSRRTWLYTIAARACQRMHRKRAGEPERMGSLDELLPFGEPLIAVIPGELDDAQQGRIRAEAR
ncbi:MAG: RNA polymerase sigma factor, partial [Planctomycetota bacterium]